MENQKTPSSLWPKIGLFILGFALALVLLFQFCHGSENAAAYDYLKHERDSLKVANMDLSIKNIVIDQKLQVVSATILRLKARIPQKEIVYIRVKEKGRSQLENHPCDSLNNLMAYDALATACDSLKADKDSVINAQDIKIDEQDEKIQNQDEQLKNDARIQENTEVALQVAEKSEYHLNQKLKKQKIKTIVVGVLGAVATALVTFWSLAH